MKIRQNNVDYGYRPKFEKECFAEPPKCYWPAYSWIWNGDLTKEGIAERLDAYYKDNIRTVYILPEPTSFRSRSMGTRMEPDYFTEEYFELYRFAVEYAFKKGMQVWLYDEAGWPSGSANGEVVFTDNSLKKRMIKRDDREIKAGVTYEKPSELIAAFTERLEQIDSCYTPEKDEKVLEFSMYDICHYEVPYPDLLNPKSTQDFIKYTHERYKKHLGDKIGPDFMIAFTDEPATSAFAWTEGFDEMFSDKYGYDYKKYLPAISSAENMGEKGIQARLDYLELISELFAKNYFRGLQDWCKDNGMLSAGHVGGEDVTLSCNSGGYVHLLRMLRCFDIPGVDTIWRQIFPKPRTERGGKIEGENMFFPRYASSAANQTASHPTLSESYAIYGAGVTADQMRYVMNFQAIRGITIFNAMNLTYCLDDHFMAGARPTFAPIMPGMHDQAAFREYAARLSYLTSLGMPAADMAVYMPMRDFWARENEVYLAKKYEWLCFELEKNQCSFDLFDDDVIESCDDAALDKGIIKLGFSNYAELWIPPCRRMPENVKQRLERFIKGGGHVYVLKDDTDPEINGAAGVSGDEIGNYASPIVKCTDKTPALRAMKRTTDCGTLYFVYNEGFETLETSFTVNDSGNVYELDELTGDIYRPDYKAVDGGTVINAKMLCGEGRVYLFTNSTYETVERPFAGNNVVCELNEFKFRKASSFVIGETRFERSELDETEITVNTGNWQEFAGVDFSGDAVYSAEFIKPDANEITVDLGTVKYSCELFVNGRSYGVRCMPPYRYSIKADELEEVNKLEIRVTNTAANQYVHTKSFDKYPKNKLGPYHATTLRFEEESQESGLYGPVRILI